MSTNFNIQLTLRDNFGSTTSRKLRREGMVPIVIYGADENSAHYATSHNDLYHNLQVEAFHSAIIVVNEGKRKQDVILREVQMHPYKPQIMHVDLQRVKSTEAITLRVPLHFIGDTTAPGVKIAGGIFSRLILDVEVQCLPKDLPEFLSVDVSNLDINETVHLSDIDLPEGVELTSVLNESDDFAIASITPSRIAADDIEEDIEGELLEGEESGSTQFEPAD